MEMSFAVTRAGLQMLLCLLPCLAKVTATELGHPAAQKITFWHVNTDKPNRGRRKGAVAERRVLAAAVQIKNVESLSDQDEFGAKSFQVKLILADRVIVARGGLALHMNPVAHPLPARINTMLDQIRLA